MYVLESKGGIDVDLYAAAGELESTVVAEASEASVLILDEEVKIGA
ncbi:MAG TPA: hypothetical protein VEK15_16975 [Vicinamibacteria bacterium]|nr:hypothetical protein [Vicinamibacteria bacterium]